MDRTNFTDAYLYGVDFTDATASGVGFGNSFLAGANFSGAHLSADGVNTGFTGAFLQGANFQAVTIENGISLQNAFVDFRPSGNKIYLQLNGNHTSFAGYWNSSGDPVCAEMDYDNPTNVPATDSSTTCPDGHEYSSDCGQAKADGSNTNWESKSDIGQWASYAYDATFTNAPSAGSPPKCTPDNTWNFPPIP